MTRHTEAKVVRIEKAVARARGGRVRRPPNLVPETVLAGLDLEVLRELLAAVRAWKGAHGITGDCWKQQSRADVPFEELVLSPETKVIVQRAVEAWQEAKKRPKKNSRGLPNSERVYPTPVSPDPEQKPSTSW